jgi:hypothetical protein
MHRARIPRRPPAAAESRRRHKSGLGTPRHRRVVGWTLVAAAFLLLLVANGAAAREWHFDVSLDGLPIGTHDISLQENGDARSVVSEMRFKVSLLGFKAGSYEQHEEETWKGDCLTRIDTKTVEKGATTTVSGRPEGGNFVIDGPGEQQRLPACVMSFAYWHPRVLKQTHLINVQTGASTPITVNAPDKEAYTVRGASVEATHYRIDTARNRIDVWYSPDGEWIGLRSTSQQGHVLAYKLK